jgi:hypothetical protein
MHFIPAGPQCPLENLDQAETFFSTKGMTGTGLGLWVSMALSRNTTAALRYPAVSRPSIMGQSSAFSYGIAQKSSLLGTDERYSPGDHQ